MRDNSKIMNNAIVAPSVKPKAGLARMGGRMRNVIKIAFTGVLSRGIAIGSSILLVPLALHYLGKEQYGVWVAISSLIAMLGFMEGGAGNAVINLVSHAYGASKETLPRIITTAYATMTLLALTGMVLFVLVHPFIPWETLLGLEEGGHFADVRRVILLVALFLFFSMIVGLIGKIQRGMQEGNLDNLWAAVGAALSLLFVYLAIELDLGFTGFAVSFLMGSVVSYLLGSLHYLVFRRPDLFRVRGGVDWALAKNILGIGLMFLAVQIAGRIQYFADNVFISNMLGPVAVTNYAVCMQLFVSVGSLFALVFLPLWPAYREAMASGDRLWVKQTFLRTIRWALGISIPLAVVMVTFGREMVEFWTGGLVSPSLSLLIGCALWMVCLAGGNALAMLLNAMQLIKFQAMIAIASGVANVGMTIFLIRQIGAEGAVYASVVSYCCCTLIPCFILVPRYWVRMDATTVS